MYKKNKTKNKSGMFKQKKRMFGICFLLIGCFLFFYPDLHHKYKSYSDSQKIEKFYQQSEQTEITENENLLKEIRDYNRVIYQENQKGLYEAEMTETIPQLEILYEHELFGTIEIPAIDCTLPLYLGASQEHLNDGAAVLGETSVPVGGNNTNSVIAAHRGWHQEPYFKYIDALQQGDVVYVTNPWERLEYKVSEIRIIAPDAIDEIRIQRGKDLITLLTCHPYRSGGKYRYMVICRRVLPESQCVENTKQNDSDKESGSICAKNQHTDKEVLYESRFRCFCGLVLSCMVAGTIIENLTRSRRSPASGEEETCRGNNTV